jgi:xanthine dehydrogenase/oxidase
VASQLPQGGDVPDPEPLLVPIGQKVWFHGQAIGVVLATSQRRADAAAQLVTATYGPSAALVLSIDDAVAAHSFFTNGTGATTLNFGENIDTALAECDKVVIGSISTGLQYHFHMETQTVSAEPEVRERAWAWACA